MRAAILWVFFAPVAWAELTSVPVTDPAGSVISGGATRDSLTNLDWLDLTIGKAEQASVDQTLAGAGPGVGWINDGWRYATGPEVCALFRNYAAANNPCPGGPFGLLATPQQAAAFMALLGITVTGVPNIADVSRGQFDDGTPGIAGTAVIDLAGFVNIVENAAFSNSVSGDGHFLVRPAQQDTANLVINPGFESGPLGWTFSADPTQGVDVGTCPAPCTVPNTGLNAGFKNVLGSGLGTISQSIPTTPGRNYLVEFWLADNGNSLATGNLSISFGDTSINVSGDDTLLTHRKFSFNHVATSDLTEFLFSGVVTGGTFFIDDVFIAETSSPAAACDDGLDNDSDGLIDFPEDPGCESSADNDESDDPPPPQCADDVDNDLDGLVDFPNDPGCSSATDNDETDPVLAQCQDGLDNDADGLIDFGRDPGCTDPQDNDESDDPQPASQCADGLDNDSDGLIDFPDDPGCASASDDDETDTSTPAQCADGVDNDSDGLIDFPSDPGCSAPSDNDESEDLPPPSDELIFDQTAPSYDNGVQITQFIAADRFSLTQATQIATFSAFLTGDTLGQFPERFGGDLSWFVFADDAGQPGEILASGTVVDVPFTATGQVLNNASGVEVYEVTGDLAPGVMLQPGDYHFGLTEGLPNDASDDTSIFWASFFPGTNFSAQKMIPPLFTELADGELGFQLFAARRPPERGFLDFETRVDGTPFVGPIPNFPFDEYSSLGVEIRDSATPFNSTFVNRSSRLSMSTGFQSYFVNVGAFLGTDPTWLDILILDGSREVAFDFAVCATCEDDLVVTAFDGDNNVIDRIPSPPAPDKGIDFAAGRITLSPGQSIQRVRLQAFGDGTGLGTSTIRLDNLRYEAPVPDSSSIANDVVLGPNVVIGENVIIRRGVTVNEGTIIGDGVTIRRDSTIGSNVTIGAGAIVARNALIANDVELAEGSKVGADSQIGVGSRLGADSAVRRDCTIGDNVMIDFSTILGRNCSVGDRVTIGFETRIRRDVQIGDDAFIGNGVIVRRGSSVPANEVIPDGTRYP